MKNFKRYVLGARVRGFSHQLKNKICQDAFSSFSRAEYDLITCSDGHGGEAYLYSDKGSECATMVFRRVMKSIVNDHTHEGVVDFQGLKSYLESFSEEIAKRIVDMWKTIVIDIYNREHRDNDVAAGKILSTSKICELYGSTLLGCLVTPHYLYFFQLGDGNIALAYSSDYVEMIFEEDDLPGTYTYSICQTDATSHVKQRIIDLPQGERETPLMVWLSTDGFYNSYFCENDFLYTVKAYMEECFHLRKLRRKQAKHQLKNWLADTSREGSADDITVVMDLILPSGYS